MKPLNIALASLAALICAPAVDAQAVPLRKFYSGMTPDQAVAAAPDADWTTHDWLNEGGPLEGAYALDAAELGGDTWDVTVGDTWGPNVRIKGRLTFEREFTYERKEDCTKAVSDTVDALEPIYGSFGTEDDFFNLSSTRYSNPWGRGYQRVGAGKKSFMREYPEHEDSQGWSTFRKPKSSENQVWLEAKRRDSDKLCYMTIEQWLPRTSIFDNR